MVKDCKRIVPQPLVDFKIKNQLPPLQIGAKVAYDSKQTCEE